MRWTCPQCSSDVERDHGSLVCRDCGYAARHGAD